MLYISGTPTGRFGALFPFSFPHERVSSLPSCLGLNCLLYLSHAC